MNLRLAMINPATEDLATTCTAGPVTAAIRQRQALAQCGLQKGLVGLHLKIMLARLDADLKTH